MAKKNCPFVAFQFRRCIVMAICQRGLLKKESFKLLSKALEKYSPMENTSVDGEMFDIKGKQSIAKMPIKINL